jgi:competence protein ComEA
MRLYFSRTEQIVVALLLLAILAALGVMAARRGRGVLTRQEAPLLQSAATTGPQPLDAAPATGGGPVVYVVGAVQRPGLYTLAPGARLHDALQAAGGPRADGAPQALNLADRAIDGQRIEVPTTTEYQRLRASQPAHPLVTTPAPRTTTRQPANRSAHAGAPAMSARPAPAQPYAGLVTAESTAPANTATATVTSAAVTAVKAPAIVHLNSATQAELETLPGVGPSTAQKILDYRAANGPFKAVDDLDNVKGIGPAKLEKIRPFAAL